MCIYKMEEIYLNKNWIW